MISNIKIFQNSLKQKIDYKLKNFSFNIWHHFLTIFILGIAAGIPIALVLSGIKANLFDKKFSIAQIGFFGLVTLPYNLKIFFAPAVDLIAIKIFGKKFGHRKSWLLLIQILLIIAVFLLMIVNNYNNLQLFMLTAFIITSLSAIQDIIIDAYRIELINEDNQGFATGFYVYGYRVGMLISGALTLIIAEKFDWQISYFLLAIFMSLLTINILLAKESKRIESSDKKSPILYISNSFKDLAKKKLWPFILIFIILFKLPDAFAGNLITPFLMDIGFTKIDIAKILKTFGLFATLFGVFCGGILVKYCNNNFNLIIAVIAQALSNLIFAYIVSIGYDTNFLYKAVFIENFCSGIGDAIFVAYLSSLCNKKFSATQYALFSSLASLSRSLFSSFAGIFATNLGWQNFFIFSSFLAIPSLIILAFIILYNRILVQKSSTRIP
jgi:PAT family beta-lactamase induction signal transducer AmpG